MTEPTQARLGAMIPRAIEKLAASTPARRQRLKILFYGQSITGQPWWREVVALVKRHFQVVEGAENVFPDCLSALPAEADEGGVYRCRFIGNRVDVVLW